MAADPKKTKDDAFGEGLQAKLERLASDRAQVVDGWRYRPIVGASGALTAFALEIDETVFGRRMTLRNDAGETLLIEAANRRLRRLVDPLPTSISVYAEQVEGQLQGNDTEVLGVLSTVVSTFAGASDAFAIQTEPITGAEAAAVYGISATALAEAWGISLLAPAPEASGPDDTAPTGGRLEAFAHSIQDNCTGWIRRDTPQGAFHVSDPDATIAQDPDSVGRWADTVAAAALALNTDATEVFAVTGQGERGLRLCLAVNEALFVADIVGLGPSAVRNQWTMLSEEPGD